MPLSHYRRKSSLSAATNCVTVRLASGGLVEVTDSKNDHMTALLFTQAEWVAFVEGVRAGEFDYSDIAVKPQLADL